MLPKFGLRISVLLDANGANTTAAAAVRAAARHLKLAETPALVLGGTGPVGQRVARLLARQGADVRVGSRQQARAAAVCQEITERVPGAKLHPIATGSAQELAAALQGRTLVIAAGAAGAVLLPAAARKASPDLKVAIDLNAVPPLGIEGIEVSDKAAQRDGVLAYGAIGVGDTKMKVHKAALARLFERNDQVLDAEEIYEIAQAF
jgi:NAD(P)-dependent dehydrogenase (short-subunit alcohol dehydrogenase family)